jgi:nucleoside-diphosphate-sugar epimerase
MRILVTGGAGYLGSVLISKILAAKTQFNDTLGPKESHSEYGGHSHQLDFDEIVVYDNLMYKQVSLMDCTYRRDFKFVHGDVRDHGKFLPYVKQADIIIPLAAIVGFPACERDKPLATEVNYGQMRFILDNTSKDQKIIFPNTNSGYGIGQNGIYCTEKTPLNPISHYGTTKCDAEKALLDSGRAITLRLATVFGVSNRMRLDLLVNDFTYKAVNEGYIVLFEKDFKRNFIHIRDVALTFIYMINEYEKHVGQAFNVGLSDVNITKLELAEQIKKYIPSFVIKVDEYNSDPDKRNYLVSNAKLEATGWTPYYTLDDGIEELIKSYGIIKNSNKKFTNL